MENRINEDNILLLSTFLLNANERIATAESITGGMIASAFTDIPGSSDWFLSGIVSYSDAIKHKVLGVKEKTLVKYTAVSKECAAEMARGVLVLLDSDVAIATTGYAGPSGENIGEVFISVATKKGTLGVKEMHYDKALSRSEIRTEVVNDAVLLALKTAFGLENV